MKNLVEAAGGFDAGAGIEFFHLFEVRQTSSDVAATFFVGRSGHEPSDDGFDGLVEISGAGVFDKVEKVCTFGGPGAGHGVLGIDDFEGNGNGDESKN